MAARAQQHYSFALTGRDMGGDTMTQGVALGYEHVAPTGLSGLHHPARPRRGQTHEVLITPYKA